MIRERCEEVMRRYLTEVVAEGRYEVLKEIADENMIDHSAMAAGWGGGRAGLEKHVRAFRNALRDAEITVERIIASDDEVVGIWRARGTHNAALFGVPATGKIIEWPTASVFKIKDGMLIDYSLVTGALEAVRRMGVPIELPEGP